MPGASSPRPSFPRKNDRHETHSSARRNLVCEAADRPAGQGGEAGGYSLARRPQSASGHQHGAGRADDWFGGKGIRNPHSTLVRRNWTACFQHSLRRPDGRKEGIAHRTAVSSPISEQCPYLSDRRFSQGLNGLSTEVAGLPPSATASPALKFARVTRDRAFCLRHSGHRGNGVAWIYNQMAKAATNTTAPIARRRMIRGFVIVLMRSFRSNPSATAAQSPVAESRSSPRQWCTASRRDKTSPPDSL